MKHDLETYRAQLPIDKHALDEELIRQPRLFEEIGRQMGLAASRRDYCKDEVKRVWAKVWAALKDEGGRTEKQIEAEAYQHKRYATALKKQRVATREFAQWEALREAWLNRGFMLRALCDLYAANYFDGNTAHKADEVVENAARRKLADKRRQKL